MVDTDIDDSFNILFGTDESRNILGKLEGNIVDTAEEKLKCADDSKLDTIGKELMLK